MQRIERTARIEASPETLFAYIADLEKLPEWQSGIVDARPEGDGVLRKGATALVTRDLMGQHITAPLTVTAHEPPRRLGIASEVSGVKAAGTLDLAEADGGRATDLTFAMEIRGSLLTAFMEPMIASAAKAEVDASLERLRRRFSPA
jgi:uncharacterized protein YndB with AHSA1/START domain